MMLSDCFYRAEYASLCTVSNLVGCGDEVVGMLTDVLKLYNHENKEYALANASTSTTAPTESTDGFYDDDDDF